MNRYPLRYWLQLVPLPLSFKNLLLDFLQRSAIGNLPLELGLGNMGVIASLNGIDRNAITKV